MTGERREGSLIGGRYRLTSGPGRDRFRLVWEAYDEVLDRRVDIQEVRPPDGLDDAERARWREGALRRARRLVPVSAAPGIVSVYDVTAEDGALWLITEQVAAQAADAYVDRLGPLPADRARQVAGALLTALGAMHAAGIAHGGLTPREVRIGDSGQVWLTGFHTWVRGPVDGVLGVPDYLAPERFAGHGPSGEGDLFALGATLSHLLRGFSPFRRESVEATIAAVRGLEEDPLPPLPDPALAPLVGGLLRRDPRRRWTLAEARGFLDPERDGVGPLAPGPALGYPSQQRTVHPAQPAQAPQPALPAQPAEQAPAPQPGPPVSSAPAPASMPRPLPRPLPMGPPPPAWTSAPGYGISTGLAVLLALLAAVLVVWLLLALLDSDGGPALLVGVLPWAGFALGVGLLAVQVRVALRRGRRARWAGRAGPMDRLLRSVAPPAPWSREERRVRWADAEEAVDRELRRLDRLTAGASRHEGGDGGTGV
ncbi:hypothetical protein [Streptomyces sp. NPDC059708]|uniref:protein kinase domain-containing protein n=1 Tax=Streptomyces sp. NPDC059708 TaxID=3346916 RepID=UPI00367C6FA4